ncbi:MAG: cell division protein FtsA, partial [Syntrophobacteraceae bacterium CG07_land_8_20_14_0_80_61_8]
IDQTVSAIKQVVEEAGLMAGVNIARVYAGIAGTHITSMNSHGVIAIKSREVTQADIDRVLDAAKAIAMPFDRRVLHVIPQQYIVDEQEGILNPLGMSGVRLEAKVHVVTGAISAVENIFKCCNRADLQVQDVVFEALAASDSVLDPDEKHLGVALVDIGGGTTNIAVFLNQGICHTAVVGLGGNHITSDISVGLRTSVEESERIKREQGCALTDWVEPGDVIEVGSVGGQKPRQLSHSILAEIIEARTEEILKVVELELIKAGYLESLNAGIVLTGGVSLLPGIRELAERVFDMPVRIGLPYKFGGLGDMVKNPMFSTATGLLLYSREHAQGDFIQPPDSPDRLRRAWAAVKGWFKEF